MALPTLARPELITLTNLTVYPPRSPFIHPSVLVGEDKAIALQTIDSGTSILTCAPALSYFRRDDDDSIGIHSSLRAMGQERLQALYHRLSSLYPRTKQERLTHLALLHPNEPDLEDYTDDAEYAIMAFLTCNEFQIGQTGNRLLYLEASKINHSCAPNATWKMGERGELTVTSSRVIAQGEEIMINYSTGLEVYPGRIRRNHLLRGLLFYCHCERCKDRCNFCDVQQATLKTCSKCKVVRYCSQACQKSDWPEHKSMCIRPCSC